MKTSKKGNDKNKVIVQPSRLREEIVILGVCGEGEDELKTARHQLLFFPRLKILAASMPADKPLLDRVLQACSTAGGGSRKKWVAETLINTVADAVIGHTAVNPPTIVLTTIKRSPASVAKKRPLSPKERQILQLLAQGLTTKAMAERLGLSPKTIDTHRQHIMDKVDVRTIAGLTKYAIREGLASVDL